MRLDKAEHGGKADTDAHPDQVGEDVGRVAAAVEREHPALGALDHERCCKRQTEPEPPRSREPGHEAERDECSTFARRSLGTSPSVNWIWQVVLGSNSWYGDGVRVVAMTTPHASTSSAATVAPLVRRPTSQTVKAATHAAAMANGA